MQPNMPKVNVLMLSYNYDKYLPAAIDSVLNQSYKDFELLIIDDASRDNSAVIIRQYASIDKRVHYTINVRNEGIVISFNHGLSQCQGDYIAYISSDDVWKPDRLKKGVDILDAKPDIDWVYSNLDIIDGAGIFRGKTTMDVLPSPTGVYDGNLLKPLLIRNFITTSGILLRRKTIGNLKLNQDLIYQNDWLFCIELAEKGQFYYIPDALCQYRVHGKNTFQDKDGYVNDSIRLVEIIGDRYGNFFDNNRSILAQHQLDIGIALCNLSRTEEGKKYLRMACKVYPVNLKAYLVLAALLFGKTLYKLFMETYADTFKRGVEHVT